MLSTSMKMTEISLDTQILDSSLACTIVMIGTYLPQLSINESAASSKVCVDDV